MYKIARVSFACQSNHPPQQPISSRVRTSPHSHPLMAMVSADTQEVPPKSLSTAATTPATPAGWTQPPPRVIRTYPAPATPRDRIKRKACALPTEGQLPTTPHSGAKQGTKSSSTDKRRRLASDVCDLLRDELEGRTVTDERFMDRLLLQSEWAPDERGAERILKRLAADREDVISDAESQEGGWQCLVPGYRDVTFVEWFCRLANSIVQAGLARENSPDPGTDPGPNMKAANSATDPSLNTKSAYPAWHNTRNTRLYSFAASRVRPDFILSCPNHPVGWPSVLVVGEHTSTKSSARESPFIELAQYAEQVFITQPFRSAVLGIVTSNTGPQCRFWRFDRGGALGTADITYDRGTGLKLLVRSLVGICRMPPAVMGFHTASISWESTQLPTPSTPATSPANINYPLGILPSLTVQLPAGGEIQILRQIFSSPGIVSRGTCVWKGLLLGETSVDPVGGNHADPASESEPKSLVAVKYAWRSSHRVSEAEIYRLSASRGVRSLSRVIFHAEYEDISRDVRLSLKTPLQHNRHYTQLVLSTYGKTISDPTLTPLEVARALLAAVVIHADLFFTGSILHRDLSINNIIVLREPTVVKSSVSPSASARQIFTTDTLLYGCLIDLDYAVDISPRGTGPRTQVPLERTGTFPFIAIQVLYAQEPHRYRHDLESLLYVFLWLCIYPCAPLPTRLGERPPHPDNTPPDSPTPTPRKKTWPLGDPLSPWFSLDPESVAAHKTSNIVVHETCFEDLLSQFKPGATWGRFKSVARRWRKHLWEVFKGTGICSTQSEMGGMLARSVSVGGDEDEEQEGEEHRATITPDQVKIGVSNWDGFMAVRKLLEKLVRELEALEAGDCAEGGRDVL